MKNQYLGIEIGGTKIQLVVTDKDICILERYRFSVEVREASAILHGIQSRLNKIRNIYSIRAIGVGFGGPVRFPEGRIVRSYQVEGWERFPLGEWLTELTGIRSIVDNDAHTAALGEAHFGSGRGYSPVFYVTLGSGVGGGLVVGGTVYHGCGPGDMEIGHIRMDKGGTVVQDRCSGWAVDRKVRESIKDEPDGILAQLVNGSSFGEARHLRLAAAKQDPLALRILEEIADDLSYALSHAVHLTHPEMIVLGGGLSMTGEMLREAVQVGIARYLMDAIDPPQIRLSALGEDAVSVGAARMAKDRSEELSKS